MTQCSTSIALSRSSSIPILTTTKPPTKTLQRRKGAKTPNPKTSLQNPKTPFKSFYGFLTSLQNPKTPFKAFLWSFDIPLQIPKPLSRPFYGLLTSL
jgi:hypothetical protein